MVAAAAVLVAMMSRPLPEVVERADLPVTPTVRDVRKAEDVGKPGRLRSVMGNAHLVQEARQTGPAQSRLDFTFDAEAEIVGVLVSVDVPPEIVIAEVAAGIGADGYGMDGRDWLIHTSSTEGGDIDEQAWFDAGFVVAAGESVSVVAWLQNNGLERAFVSPEVIVYYRWR